MNRLKKIIWALYHCPTWSSPKWWFYASPMLPPCQISSHSSPPSSLCVFCQLLYVYLLCVDSVRSWHVFILPIFDAHFDGPNNRIISHPTLITQLATIPSSNPLLLLTFGWLLCLFVKWCHMMKCLLISLILYFVIQLNGPNDGIMSNFSPLPNCPAHYKPTSPITVTNLQLVVESFNWMAAT